MGSFTLLMVIGSYFYAIQSQNALLSVSFLAINALFYFLPLIMNVGRLKVCDYLKGIIYNIYLTPTYITPKILIKSNESINIRIDYFKHCL